MANFSIPMGRDAERRLPTTDERQNGFPCGAASQALFNGLFHRIESEIGEVISHAGLTPDDTDLTQLRQAINALIAASTGEGETSDYILLSQAKSRLPIFPEFLTSDGRVTVTSPSTGTVRLPGSVNFLHRGISPHTTTQTDFSTTASKAYHLRWNETDGFSLKDLADSAYNPSSLAETSDTFDSSFDDMLVARVITNSSNVATITNLANKNNLTLRYEKTTLDAGTAGVFDVDTIPALTADLNLARTPKGYITEATMINLNNFEFMDRFWCRVDRYSLNAKGVNYSYTGSSATGVFYSTPIKVTVEL